MNLRNLIFGKIFPFNALKDIVLRRAAGKGVSLMYHEVLPDDEGPAAWTVVKATEFKAQMRFLKKYFDIININDALKRIKDLGRVKKPFAIVTFDDGYLGNLSCVLPVIERLKIPIHVYISTHATETGKVYWYDTLISLFNHYGKLEVSLNQFGLGTYQIKKGVNEKKNWAAMQRLLTALKTLAPQKRKEIVADIVDQMGKIPSTLKMMDIEQLKTLSESMFVTIGGHSHCHNILTQLSDADLNESLHINRNKLIEWTGQNVDHFSYPNGDYDERVVSAVKQAGYKTAVTTYGKHWSSDIHPFKLPRYGIGRFDSLGLFIARLGQLT